MNKYDQALVLLSIVFSIAGTWLFDSGNFGFPRQARARKKRRQAWSFGLLSVGFALGAISFFWS
jgi:hypothetical protein